MAQHSILVVEDEHTLRRLLEYRLGKQYDVKTAANGEEALTRVSEHIPDLIVSDIMMPKMDGFALQAALQGQTHTRAIPFIFLTAKADETSRKRGMRTGVDDYITKPFDIEQLLSRIERLLERTHIYRTQLDAKIGQDFSQKLMPKKLPSVNGYRVFFNNTPREHGGGDLFDWTESAPGRYFFTIGDVMGKGLQAKFYAFSFLSYVRGTLHVSLQNEKSPAKLMGRVNQVLMQDDLMEETFASLLLFEWNTAEHRVTYANAGHCRPVLLGAQGAEIVTYSDLILGLDPAAEFRDSSLEIPPGGSFVVYTDGLMEQRMKDGQQLGEDGVMAVAQEVADAPDPVEALLETVLSRSESPEFGDDILVFWIQRRA